MINPDEYDKLFNVTNLIITNILDSQLFCDLFSNLSKQFIKYSHYYLNFFKYFQISKFDLFCIFDNDFIKKGFDNIIHKCEDIYYKNMIDYMNTYK